MSLDESFERDLRRWVHRFYLQRERAAAEHARIATERLFDRERHLLTGLSAQLLVTIALLPWWGFWGVVVGLVVLYLGTLVSGAWALRKEGRLIARRPPEALKREAEQAMDSCPRLDADARALLTRVMNLAEIRPTPRSLELLRRELGDARQIPALVGWRFLRELATFVESPEAARLGMLASRSTE